ncbi:MAG: hypothetical protein RMI35_03255 [Leptospiraceae bacterium]|nr:hypothetical protein [Leptospiraceae bacterium]
MQNKVFKTIILKDRWWTLRYKFFIISFFFFLSCHSVKQIPFIKEILDYVFGLEEFHPCDPFLSYYEHGDHYFSKEFVKEDGTIDYEKLLKYQREVHRSKCDPLNKQP